MQHATSSNGTFRIRISILHKILIPVLLFFFLTVGAVTYLTFELEKRALTRQLIYSAEITARNVAFATHSAFWSLGWAYLEEFLHGIGEDTGYGIIFVKVIRPDGQVFLADKRDYYGETVPYVLSGTDRQLFYDVRLETETETGILLAYPLTISHDVWHVLVGISLQDVQESLASLMRRNLLWGLMVLLVSAGSIYFILRATVRPIMELAHSTQIVAAGDLTHTVAVRHRDEVGLLGYEFNRMIEGLKRTQTDLRTSETRYRTLIESASEAKIGILLTCNTNGRTAGLKYANQWVSAVSGYSREHLQEMTFCDLVLAEDRPLVETIYAQTLSTGASMRERRFRWCTRSGAVIPVECTAALTEYEDRDALVLFVQDITEALEAEEQLQNYSADLEHTVAIRTRELTLTVEHLQKTQNQLIQSEKIASVGRLAAGIAHDFNNILQSINGYAQLLLLNKDVTHPDYKKALQITRSGERAAGLVQQLLLFSRNMEGQRRPSDLNREIRTAKNMLQHSIPRMITIELKLDDHLWAVATNPVQMEQILLNLGSNAADAMPDGGRLTIATSNVQLDAAYCEAHLNVMPGPYALLSVSDTGCGMDEQTRQNIFDPFFTTKEIGKGTGLGLASVHGIVHNHGGHILCYSEVGHGTTFKIYLPALEQAAAAEDPDTPAFSGLLPGGSETILVTDDEPYVREIAGDLLTQLGYTVLFAENGETALAMYQKQPNDIDLVLLDLGMPGMGGRKCLEALKALNPNIRVIIASGYASQTHFEGAMELGAAAFISKPYQLGELAVRVREVLNGPDFLVSG